MALACGGSLADQATELEAVVVKGQALGGNKDQPYSVTTFSQQEIRERQVTQTQQLFREVPGMAVRGLGYDGVADSMTLRGFSGGGHGGDIGFVIDGIPLNEASSHADGYADLNVVVPLELEGMDVFKGPVSALYGNFNRAGVVALRSRKGGNYREADLRLGSHGTVDLQGAVGATFEGGSFNGAAQVYRSHGYRPETGSHRATLSGRLAYQLGSATQLSVAARLHRAESDTASVITQAQYNRRDGFFDKDPNVQNDGADKDFATLRTDLAHSLSPELKLLAFAYATHQNFSRYFTRLTNATTWQQRSEDYQRQVLGFGVNLNGDHRLLGAPLRWAAGVERYDEDTAFKYADALANRRFTAATLTAGVNGGGGTLDRRLSTQTNSLFGQAEWALDPLLRPTLGLRHDRIGGGCTRNGIETRTGATAQCGPMADFSVTTPKIGLRSTWIPQVLEARASVAEGFALPSDAAKFTAGLAVEPTTFRQHELGLNFRAGSDLKLDLAYYRIHSNNEVALTNSATLAYGNIGQTRRDGVEAEVRYLPTPWFEATAALSRTRAKVTETLATSPFLLGSAVTGVPRTLATIGATLRPTERHAITATARHVGRMAISQPSAAAPAQHYGGYSTLDLMASYEPSGSGAGHRRYYLQVANLTNKRYATSAGVSSGVTTYNPGAPRSLSVGASLDF